MVLFIVCAAFMAAAWEAVDADTLTIGVYVAATDSTDASDTTYVVIPVTVIAATLSAPFLALPFAEGTEYTITETWEYSGEERAIHGFSTHYAVDFAAERGTPVYAPVSGYALSSFHLCFAAPEDGRVTWESAKARTRQGKFIGFGLGRFAALYDPEREVFISFGHLQSVSESVPYVAPEPVGDGWNPTALYRPLDEVMGLSRLVARGELIGHVGDTGCSWGYLERPDQERPAPDQYPSWDETHVHMEVYRRNEAGGKSERFNPLDLLIRKPVFVR